VPVDDTKIRRCIIIWFRIFRRCICSKLPRRNEPLRTPSFVHQCLWPRTHTSSKGRCMFISFRTFALKRSQGALTERNVTNSFVRTSVPMAEDTHASSKGSPDDTRLFGLHLRFVLSTRWRRGRGGFMVNIIFAKFPLVSATSTRTRLGLNNLVLFPPRIGQIYMTHLSYISQTFKPFVMFGQPFLT